MGYVLWAGTGSELASQILGQRDRHLVVISQRTDSSALHLDADYIADELDGLADVIVLRNVDEAYKLAESLPDDWSVYGNSARGYPAALSRDGVRPTRYVVAHAASELKRAADELIELVRAMAPPPAALAELASQQTHPAKPDPYTGRIVAFLGAGERAWVELANGERAVVRQQDVIPGVRLDWILASGQSLTGIFDPETRILDIAAAVQLPRVGQVYGWGSVVLCLVEAVSSRSARLLLMPGEAVDVSVQDITSNPLDEVEDLLTEGQVVVARLMLDRGRRRLSLIDVDDDEIPVAAPVLVSGGTPWLQFGRNLLPPTSEEMTQGAAEVIHPGQREEGARQLAVAPTIKQGPALSQVQVQLEVARAEIRRLQGEQQSREEESKLIFELQTEVQLLRNEVRENDAELNRLRTDARKKTEALMKARERFLAAERKLGRITEQESKFATQEELFRHELRLAWVDRVPAVEKKDLPMRKFTLGPKFLSSFYGHTAAHRNKALKALVDLLTNRAATMPARQIHYLRTGYGAEERPVIRQQDSAWCWRMYIENDVPAARRIHYWEVPGGGLELHELVSHDMVSP